MAMSNKRKMTPREYIKIEREQQAIKDLAQSVVNAAYDEVCNCPLPANLRRANFEDNIENTVLWDPKAEGRKWVIIEQVHHETDLRSKLFADAFWFAGELFFIAGRFIEVEEE